MRQIDPTFGGGALWATLASAIAPVHGLKPALPLRARRRSRRLACWLSDAGARTRLWQCRRHGRQQLLTLDDHLLRDIGISRLQAEAEAHKPFWRA
jgi:uncharacterized protein YjiS (DUF1127 family)